MNKSQSVFPSLPRWVAWLYGFLAAVTLPWTIYLALTLPTRHLSRHWDVAWVGLDVAILVVLLLNAIFSYNNSKWLVMSATATSTLLVMDAWFDVMSGRGKPLVEAIVLALFIELPLALMTFLVAMRMVKHRL